MGQYIQLGICVKATIPKRQMEGKILMECYYDFLRYIENIISKSSSNKLNSAVKAVIS